jgi:hypothetical protein
MYIELFGASDRMGGNISDMVSQMAYAFKNKLYIKYNRKNLKVYNSYNQEYNETIFMQTLFDIIDFYNQKNSLKELGGEIDLTAPTHFEVLSKSVLNIENDLISYFKNSFYGDYSRENFLNKGRDKGYEIPFDPKKTILVHLRLEDVKNRPDYDGRNCGNYFRDKIERGSFVDGDTDSEIRKHNPFCNMQSPLKFQKIQNIIDLEIKENPDLEVIIITNPGEDLSSLPYRCISNSDPSYDLFLLCNCETLILSRSTFALASLFFGTAKKAHIPLWGLIPCYGLYTKYDKNNFNYFS